LICAQLAPKNMSSKILRNAEGVVLRKWYERELVCAGVEEAFADDSDNERRKEEKDGRELLQEELSRIQKAEYEKGLQAGMHAAHADAQLRVESAVEQLGETLHKLAGVKAKLRREAESEMLSLVFAVARRIVRREFTVDPDAIRGLLHAGLEQIAEKELQAIHVHPDLVDRVSTELRHRGMSSAEVIPDRSLSPGDITYETSRGILDSRIETQFAEIERGLADRL